MKFGNVNIGGMSFGSIKIGGAKYGNTLVYQSGGGPTPPYDSQVEYLQFSQSSLNTGIVVSGTGYKVEIQCQVIDNYSSTQIIVGVGDGRGQWFGNIYADNTGRYGLGTSSGQYFSSFSSSTKKLFTISYGSRTSASDGSSTITVARLSEPDPIHIGRSGATNYWAYMKVWYIKIYNGSTLVRDYIPVKKEGVGYFYDRVTKTLYGNEGTNDFVIGE